MELPKIVHASTILLTNLQSDLTTEIWGFEETLLEVREVRTTLTHKADQLQGAENQWMEELETNEIQEDYLGKCHELIERLNEAEIRLSENVAFLKEKLEANGEERGASLMGNN